MTTDPDQPHSPDGSHSTEVGPKSFKFVGPYDWAIYTQDGTLTSDWAMDKDSYSEAETGATPSGRAFAKDSAAGPSFPRCDSECRPPIQQSNRFQYQSRASLRLQERERSLRRSQR